MTGSSSSAEEIAQETFVRAYFALGSYKPAYPFGTWLRRIAINLALNAAQREARQVSVEDEAFDAMPHPAQDDPAESAERRETRAAIWAALGGLSREHRVLIVLRHIDELSYQEIAEATGLPMGTVKSRIARARRQLQASLRDESGGAAEQ
jgi:RNA polymerase sigma-70 factor (ECF subfamily)